MGTFVKSGHTELKSKVQILHFMGKSRLSWDFIYLEFLPILEQFDPNGLIIHL